MADVHLLGATLHSLHVKQNKRKTMSKIEKAFASYHRIMENLPYTRTEAGTWQAIQNEMVNIHEALHELRTLTNEKNEFINVLKKFIKV
jgi:hypothetical protein